MYYNAHDQLWSVCSTSQQIIQTIAYILNLILSVHKMCTKGCNVLEECKRVLFDLCFFPKCTTGRMTVEPNIVASGIEDLKLMLHCIASWDTGEKMELSFLLAQ